MHRRRQLVPAPRVQTRRQAAARERLHEIVSAARIAQEHMTHRATPRDAPFNTPRHQEPRQIESLVDLRHAVIADDDDRGGRPGAPRVDRGEQTHQLRILLAQADSDVGMSRPLLMADIVSTVPVTHDQSGAFAHRQIQPRDDLIDFTCLPDGAVERRDAIARPLAVPVGLRADPEVGRGPNPLPFRGNPQGFGLNPVGAR